MCLLSSLNIDTDKLKQTQKFSFDDIKEWFSDKTPAITAFIVKVIIAIIVILIAIRIIKFIRKVVTKSLTKAGLEQGVIQFLDSVIKIVLYIVLLLAVLNQFGVQTTSIVAVLGSAGLAIGLALQGSLANFAGGVLILILKPFVVGDYILEDTQKNEGFVSEISIFYTRLRTVDNKIIVIPNGTLANASLTNYTGQKKRIVDVTVGIAYNSDVKKAKAVLENTLNKQPYVLVDEEHKVFVSELGASAIIMGVRMWVLTENYWPARWALIESIRDELVENNIEIAYDHLDITVKNEENTLDG